MDSPWPPRSAKSLSSGKLRINTHSQLIAVVPHVLGFHPEDSLVVMPVDGSGPFARIDLPHRPKTVAKWRAHSLKAMRASREACS
jgi:hypothetical protein